MPPALDQQAVQRHLDDWLDSCLRDAPALTTTAPHTASSSSTEFLDQKPPAAPYGVQRLSAGGVTSIAAGQLFAQMYGHGGNGNGNASTAAQTAKMFASGGGGGSGGSGPRPQPHSNETTTAATPTRLSMHDPFGNYQKVSVLS